MEQQEIFDKVATHLFTQGKRAMKDSGSCAYRGDGGTMCAVGCLIPDEMYDPKMDDSDAFSEGQGTAVNTIWEYFPDVKKLLGSDNYSLLSSLQSVHDNEYNWLRSKDMRSMLETIAKGYGLNYDILATLSFSVEIVVDR